MTDEMSRLVEKAASAPKAAGAKEVYVFGSASKGKMRFQSDFDLAVSGLPPEVFFRAMAAAHDALGRPLDLIDLDEDNAFHSLFEEQRGTPACGMNDETLPIRRSSLPPGKVVRP